jgi:hypothetical protein
LVSVFVLVWFENKVPSFTQLDTKYRKKLQAVVFYAVVYEKNY